MIKSLKYKFVLINMILITIVLVAIFITVYVSTQQRLVRDSMDVLQHALIEADKGQTIRNDNGGPGRKPGFWPAPTFLVNLDKNNRITSTQGNLYEISDQKTLSAVVKQCLANNKDTGIIADESLRYLKQPVSTGTIIVFADRSLEIHALAVLIRASILVGLASLLIFFVISFYLGNWALRPVAKAWDQQRKFVADASHELRTPLSVILANVGIVLSHRQSTIQEQSKWIEYIETEANRMNILVDNLLFLARSDDTKNTVVLSRLNLSDVVYGALLPFESVVFEQEKNLDTQISPDLFVNGEENQLKQLVAILLDNAIKYADDRGSINVRLFGTSDHKVLLAVNNTGVPIPADQIEHIFDRFYRVDEARAREQGGYGLGLSIAQNIVLVHNARIGVQSSEGAGTTFTVVFDRVSA